MTDVRYGLSVIPPRSAMADAEKTGFAESVGANIQTSWFVQLGRKAYRESLPADPNYDPFQNMQGYEDYAADLAEARSAAQMDLLKRQIDDNLRDERKIANSGWYWTSMFTAGLADPANIVPIPVLKGVGFVRGAVKGGASVGALSLATETMRQASDPLATPDQIPGAVGFGMLLGSTFGAISGARLDQKAVTQIKSSLRTFTEAPYRDFYGDAAARNIKSGELGVEIVDGDPGGMDIRIDDTFDTVETMGESIAPPPQKTVERKGNRNVYKVDGKRVSKKVYDSVNPEAKGNPIRRVTVNEAKIKAEFDSQPWVAMGLQPDDIRSPEEWLTFRVLYEMNRKQAGIDTPAPALAASAPERISLAAIKIGDEIYEGTSHFDAVMAAAAKMGVTEDEVLKLNEQIIDGFTTSTGRFVDRTEADAIAKATRQTDPDNDMGGLLSENMTGEAKLEMANQLAQEPASVQQPQPAAVPRETQMQLVRDTFDELRSRRTAYSFAGAMGLEKLWSERISPVGRAVGAFRDDPDSTALPLLLGGDSSVMSRAHQAGATLPASVFVKSQQHQGRFYSFRHTFDHHYLRAVKGPEVGPGVSALGQNMSAAVTGWGQRWNKLRGRSSLTTYDFNEMVGNAVIHLHNPVKLRELIPDDHIRTEVLAVAQKHQELMQFYEAELRRVGIDIETVSIEREAAWLQRSRDRKVDLIRRINDQAIQRRTVGLTEKESGLIQKLTEEISTIDAKLADVPEILRSLKETPRVGPNNEPYFSRFWAIDKVQGEREAFTDMLTVWYDMTQAPGTPGTPRERAERTVAKILDEIPDEVAEATSLSRNASPMHLKGRELDIPNSFEWRGVKVSDFIETGVLDVTEAYIRRMAPFIEMARMFGGDRTGQKTIDDMRDALIERYVLPAAPEDRAAAIAKIDEYVENIEDVRDRVIGTFHQRSPWAIDNRSARAIRNVTMLAQMGGSAITSLVDVARIPMAYGFSSALRAPLSLLMGDLQKLRPNLQFAQENGIALEMVNASTAGRVVEQSGIQFGYGGSRPEQWLANRIPGFFKLNLLSQLTVVTKQWANLTAQHHLIRAAKAVADGSAGQDDIQWLASLGINKRDARLLARMPSEATPSGELNLPSVHNWPDDVDGQRARQLLSSALYQQVNRVIITPSLMDLPNISAGVLKAGDARYESQLFGLPLQFQSFGIAAANRMMVSGLQGRERSLAYGVLLAISMGMMVDWIKSPDYAWQNKSLLDKVVRGYEISGVGGFLFSDLPQMVEVATQGTVGLRPLLGLPPPYGRTRMDAPFEPLLGPGVGQFTETLMAFTDPEVANTQRALLVKQLVPYNNLLWWNTILRRMVSSSVQNLEQPANE